LTLPVSRRELARHCPRKPPPPVMMTTAAIVITVVVRCYCSLARRSIRL
jgi:hypothetical protein